MAASDLVAEWVSTTHDSTTLTFADLFHVPALVIGLKCACSVVFDSLPPVARGLEHAWVEGLRQVGPRGGCCPIGGEDFNSWASSLLATAVERMYLVPRYERDVVRARQFGPMVMVQLSFVLLVLVP
mmetsp:Transcript_64896/g.173995  ORF Transcript_64896/g.173995 Transcript_64896/m.173995 type:complete len:127 (-) Transcript_64896:93-473(-)